MKIRELLDLVVLGMLWGASFLMVKVAAPEFGATALIEIRVLLAAGILLPVVLLRRQLGVIVSNWRPIAIMGVLHYAIPFTLFAYSMMTLSPGYSSIINASSPLFAGMIARFWLRERLSPGRIAGLAVGLIGVALLVGDRLSVGDGSVALAVAAAVAASFCYGFAAVLARRQLSGVSPMAVAGGSMAAASLALLPFAVWFWPDVTPSAPAWGNALILGVLSTAVAFVLYFRLIAAVGPSKAITVTFVIPLFAIVLGAVVLDAPVSATMVGGGLVILLGTGLSTGLIDLQSLRSRSRVVLLRVLMGVAVLSFSDDIPVDMHLSANDIVDYR